MVGALIEDPRATLCRQKVAGLLRRASCRWISFAVGTAPIHRSFFEAVAVALEGLPTSEVKRQSGISHRQVQYGVRLRIAASDADHASYDHDRDLLTVPTECAFSTLNGQATIVSACVHLGLLDYIDTPKLRELYLAWCGENGFEPIAIGAAA